MHKQLRRPNLQRSIFSFARTTPTDLVRSKLSTTEIQSRALTYIPDELLANIPDDDSTYSLFEGFKATVPELAKEDKKHKRKMSRGRKLIEDNASESSSPGPPGLHKLKKEKGKLEHKFQMLGIRKHMAESEIKEIDKKIENLARMRQVVLNRLEGLEDEEIAMEHELVDVEERLEDAHEAHDIAVARGQDTLTKVTGEDRTQSPDEAGMDASFMSESIYQKLPVESTTPTKMKRQRPVRKRSMPVLHEHFEPGAKIQELQAHTQPVTALDFDVPFGTMVTAALDDTVKVWDLQAGRCIGLLEGHASTVRALQVEDNICATGSMDATVRLWDLSRARYEPEIDNKINKAEEEEEVEESFFDLAPKPKEPETPPVGAMDDTPLFTLDGHVDEVTALCFKDQTLISGSADKTLRQWDLQQGRCVQTLDVMWAAAQASATSSAWGPSGRVSDTTADFVGALQVFDAALACGTADGMVRLWDLRSGQVHKSLVGHTGPVTCLQFDDVHLVTGSLDRSIRVSLANRHFIQGILLTGMIDLGSPHWLHLRCLRLRPPHHIHDVRRPPHRVRSWRERC